MKNVHTIANVSSFILCYFRDVKVLLRSCVTSFAMNYFPQSPGVGCCLFSSAFPQVLYSSSFKIYLTWHGNLEHLN